MIELKTLGELELKGSDRRELSAILAQPSASPCSRTSQSPATGRAVTQSLPSSGDLDTEHARGALRQALDSSSGSWATACSTARAKRSSVFWRARCGATLPPSSRPARRVVWQRRSSSIAAAIRWARRAFELSPDREHTLRAGLVLGRVVRQLRVTSLITSQAEACR